MGGASQNNIKHVRVVINKIFRIILHVKQDDQNIPEIGVHELYRTLSVLKLYDVYSYNLLKFIRFAMNDRPKLFEEFYEPHLSLQNYHTRNSRFNLHPVRLDVEKELRFFSKYKIFQCCSCTALCAHV